MPQPVTGGQGGSKMYFRELTNTAKQKAYSDYCHAMDDDLNRDDIVSIEEYEAGSEWDEITFDVDGNCI